MILFLPPLRSGSMASGARSALSIRELAWPEVCISAFTSRGENGWR